MHKTRSRTSLLVDEQIQNLSINSLNVSVDSDVEDFRGFPDPTFRYSVTALSSLADNLNLVANMPNQAQNTEQLIAAAGNYGKVLPKFTRNSSTIETFISKVDTYYEKYGNTDNATLNEYVFCLISSRLTDEAENLAATRSDLNTWPLLKAALREKFGDLIDTKILAHEFKFLKIKTHEKLNEFIDRIKVMKTRLDVKVQANENYDAAEKTAYKKINEQTAIEVIYNNCPVMLQNILDVKDDQTLVATTNTVLNYISRHPAEKTPITKFTPNSRPPVMNNPRLVQRPINSQWTNRSYFPQQQNNYPSQYNPTFARPNYQFPPRNNWTNQQPQFFNRNQNTPPQNVNRNTTTQVARPNSNIKTNKFDGTAFRQWRQPRPQINFTEIDPSYTEEYHESQSENPLEHSETFYEEFSDNPNDVPAEENVETYSEQTPEFNWTESSHTEYPDITNFRQAASKKPSTIK